MHDLVGVKSGFQNVSDLVLRAVANGFSSVGCRDKTLRGKHPIDAVYIEILVGKDFLYISAFLFALGGFVNCLVYGVLAAYDFI